MAEGGFLDFNFEYDNDIELNLPYDVDSLEVLELRIIAKANMNTGFCYLALDQTDRILRPIFNTSKGQCCWPKKVLELNLDTLYNFQVMAYPGRDMRSTPFPHCNEDVIIVNEFEEASLKTILSQPPYALQPSLLSHSDIQAIYGSQNSYSPPFPYFKEDNIASEFEEELSFQTLLSPQPPLKCVLCSLAKSDVQDIFGPNVNQENFKFYVDENTNCKSAGILRSKATVFIEYKKTEKKYKCKVECPSGTYTLPVTAIDVNTENIYPDALIVLGLGRPLAGGQGKYPTYCPARCYLIVVGIYPL